MNEARDTKQLSPIIERVAKEGARGKANIAKWGVNIAVFLFALLITIIILTSQGVGIYIVAPLAILGLGTV